MTPEEKRQLKEVYEFIQLLKRASSIPLSVEKAFAYRFKLRDYAQIDTSATVPATFTQAVDEGGAATYNVAKPMTGFSSIVDANGNTITVATYD